MVIIMGIDIDYGLVFGTDKIIHFLLFFFIAFLLGFLLLLISDRLVVIQSIRILSFALVMIGLIEEYRQYFEPTRSAEFLDAIANLLGVYFGLLVPRLVCSWLARKGNINNSSKALVIYFLITIPLLIGLIGLNERPFIKIL